MVGRGVICRGTADAIGCGVAEVRRDCAGVGVPASDVRLTSDFTGVGFALTSAAAGAGVDRRGATGGCETVVVFGWESSCDGVTVESALLARLSASHNR